MNAIWITSWLHWKAMRDVGDLVSRGIGLLGAAKGKSRAVGKDLCPKPLRHCFPPKLDTTYIPHSPNATIPVYLNLHPYTLHIRKDKDKILLVLLHSTQDGRITEKGYLNLSYFQIRKGFVVYSVYVLLPAPARIILLFSLSLISHML